MESKTGLLPADREILLKDYETDIRRRLDQKVGSSTNPLEAIDRVNHFLVSEIAQLKLQVTELELTSIRQDRSHEDDNLRPSIEHVWPSMPIYDVGSQISLGGGIISFGFHFPEMSAGGAVQRWSGPSTRSGLVALINRAAPIIGELLNVSFIDPSVEIIFVAVDGERVKHEWTDKKALRFFIPPIKNSDGPVPTQITFVVNRCLVVRDVRPENLDSRAVGFCTTGLKLMAHDGSPQ